MQLIGSNAETFIKPPTAPDFWVTESAWIEAPIVFIVIYFSGGDIQIVL